MRILVLLIVLLVLSLTGYALYSVRTSTHDPELWHVNPLTVPPQPSPNGYRVADPEMTDYAVDRPAPIYAGDAGVIATAFDTFVMGQPRIEKIAGSVEDRWITYVQRTEALRFPDYISVRFIDLEGTGTSTVAIFSRSRYGYGDMGVNQQRVDAWLKALESFEE